MKAIRISKSVILGAVAALGASSMTSAAVAQEAPRVFINGERFRAQAEPIVEQSRVLVPMRAIFERLGARVDFDARDQSILASRGRTDVRMALGSTRARVNGEGTRLDVPATSYNGRTYVPLRFVSEALGATVDFNSTRNAVSINERERGRRNEGRLTPDGYNRGRDNERPRGNRLREWNNDSRRDDWNR